ncbi:MAG: ATP-binding protein [Pseudomonadota bacterium]
MKLGDFKATDAISSLLPKDYLYFAFDSLDQPVAVFGNHGELEFANKACLSLSPKLSDASNGALSLLEFWEILIFAGLIPNDGARQVVWLGRQLDRKTDGQDTIELGPAKDQVLRLKVQRLPDGGTLITGYDVSELVAAQESLETSERLLRESQKIARIGSWEWDEIRQRTTVATEEALRIFGYENSDDVDWLEEYYERVHPDDQSIYRRLYQDTHTNPMPYEIVYRLLQPDQSYIFVEEIAVPLFDEDGFLLGYRGTIKDVTDRAEAEAKLRQAQKLESLGQLTGGVAHEFNNLLGIILGHSELLAKSLGSEQPQIKAIIKAATRSADVTRQLLAFSRSQTLQPVPVDLNQVLLDFVDILKLSFDARIELKTRPAPGLWRCLADVSQLECALLNLALNARDAMPGGGKLVFEAKNAVITARDAAESNLKAGDYVLVMVHDTGQGMTADVQERALEPFFSTKDVGKGSGLGLSMIFGFAKQSGGHVTILSEAGEGTRVLLYLPRQQGDA